MTSNPTRVTPSFLILGAPKCGTTSLAYWLREHPQVFVPSDKELYFFDYYYDLGLDWYRERLNGAGCAAVGEATPAYLATAEAPARIAKAAPNVRLIALVRNPVDRAYSHYLHWFQEKQERRTFREVVEFELGQPRSDRAEIWDPRNPDRYSYLAFGRYHSHIERYIEHFSAEQLLVMLLEDLRDDPANAFRRTCDHIGVDGSVVPDSVGETFFPYRSYRPWWLWSLIQRVRLARFLPRSLGAMIWQAMVHEGDAYEPMASDLRLRLTEHYAADNAALEKLLGRDLSHWSAASIAPTAV